MKITRRTDYAIHLIADLSDQPDSCTGLRSLAEQHGVTYAFARTVQQGLLKAGVIKANRGINGGIRLAKPLEDITLLEVFEAAQNPMDVTFDSDDAHWCKCEDHCITEKLWQGSRKVLGEYLSGITMADLLAGR
ncbi:MAG: Rrf2 family transcriptional regulator [Coriobacteriales bacterium]|jgi:Rrf2 family protein|nr:Rrf2 family transcriptional regulator [Coriobacteriales bacterium]